MRAECLPGWAFHLTYVPTASHLWANYSVSFLVLSRLLIHINRHHATAHHPFVSTMLTIVGFGYPSPASVANPRDEPTHSKHARCRLETLAE